MNENMQDTNMTDTEQANPIPQEAVQPVVQPVVPPPAPPVGAVHDGEPSTPAAEAPVAENTVAPTAAAPTTAIAPEDVQKARDHVIELLTTAQRIVVSLQRVNPCKNHNAALSRIDGAINWMVEPQKG